MGILDKISPVGARLATAGLLIVCGAVVLGISIHIEHSARTIGFKSHTFTYDAFVGAFTLFFEICFIVLRLTSKHHNAASLAAEFGLSTITWVFYLAAGIDTTIFTDEDRSVCRHLNSLLDVPEFEGLDPQALDIIKKVFQDVCSELHAQLAFIWIGFVCSTVWLVMLIALIVRLRRNGGTTWTRVSLQTYQGTLHTHNDPFVDPVGNLPGPSVGVPQDDDPDYKP